MRLRYLHLPRCGPLVDTTVVFGREDLIAQTLNLPRRGSLNFVVGVNGSGKSSLLRAIYRALHALKSNEPPPMPLTLAWDIFLSRESQTAVLHIPTGRNEKPWFLVGPRAQSDLSKENWLHFIEQAEDEQKTSESGYIARRGDDVFGSFLQAYLPKRVIAYTSGSDESWLQLQYPIFQSAEESKGQYDTEDERPPGWTIEREWEEEQPVRIANVLRRYAMTPGDVTKVFSEPAKLGELTTEAVERLRQELGPLEIIRDKVLTNRMAKPDGVDDSYFRIQTHHLRFAGIILGLWQAATEMSGRAGESQRNALRDVLLVQRASVEKPKDARRVLNEIDWFWPTHLSITYRDDGPVSPTQNQELLCLVALADEVIAQPRGRQRAILSLGPSDGISLTEKLKDAFPHGLQSKNLDFIAERVDGSKTMAEAILRLFSADRDIDSTPMDVFSRLRHWERSGLLEDLTLTIKRLHPVETADGEADDVIVTYNQLSDGEQMLLGRMGMIFLLRGQAGSLLLLDEPETHFNDVWKREIVEMVDMGLLNSTNANVIIATHTSIALTDAFAAEVTVLDKTKGQTTARGVTGGLFGTDPGEVAMNLFRAESSIGTRSMELLDQLLKTEWKGRESDLEEILKVLGSSFHRAELRAILKELRANPNGTAPS
jgi:predicted ATPase